MILLGLERSNDLNHEFTHVVLNMKRLSDCEMIEAKT